MLLSELLLCGRFQGNQCMERWQYVFVIGRPGMVIYGSAKKIELYSMS